jgi:hypothetical protein
MADRLPDPRPCRGLHANPESQSAPNAEYRAHPAKAESGGRRSRPSVMGLLRPGYSRSVASAPIRKFDLANSSLSA